MGLKKEGTPGEAAPSEVVNPQAAAPAAKTPTTAAPPAATPTPPPQAKAPEAKQKKGTRTMALRAAKRRISDPFTGAVYVTEIGRPGILVPGNWIDAQVQAGVLVECSASILDE